LSIPDSKIPIEYRTDEYPSSKDVYLGYVDGGCRRKVVGKHGGADGPQSIKPTGRAINGRIAELSALSRRALQQEWPEGPVLLTDGIPRTHDSKTEPKTARTITREFLSKATRSRETRSRSTRRRRACRRLQARDGRSEERLLRRYIWRAGPTPLLEEASPFDVDPVRKAVYGKTFAAPVGPHKDA